ncbi:MAG: type II secretion system F family protein [Nocardioides sp.]
MTRALRTVVLVFLTGIMALLAASASAADGTIDYVEPTDDGVQILVSVPPDATVDYDGVKVSIDGVGTEAVATPAAGDPRVRRTAVLAIDTSNSMAGPRFQAAKLAALTYLDAVPDDVYVGIVSFAAEVTEDLVPSLDRQQARAVIDQLSLTSETRLYDGVLAAAALAGTEGQRSLLVLSDGADTSNTPLKSVTTALTEGELLVQVVALDQSGPELAALRDLAAAGGGEVLNADSDALAATFSAEAAVLANQVLVIAQVPDDVTASEASIDITLPSEAGEILASAFSIVRSTAVSPASPLPDQSRDRGVTVPGWVMYAGIGALGVGLVALLMLLVPAAPGPMSIADRVASYTSSATGAPTKPESDAPLTQATQAVEEVLKRNQGLEQRITQRLEGAGSDLKSSEWLLLHAAIFVGSGLLGLLLGQGSLLLGLVFLAVGAVGPWLYLGFRRSRRRKAFNATLPDTLSLMSGSLSAGLSLAQSVDTIVREGTEPVASEFKRVLIETRLGVPLEDSLVGVAERFESKDFEWVIMAIRIQRQVGGNLAELLDTVAATMRERQYLRRQVNSLAAEGKLSAYVLSVLPPGFLLYLVFAQRDYVMPLFTDIRGIFMLVGATFWLLVGIFWMSKLVKVEV